MDLSLYLSPWWRRPQVCLKCPGRNLPGWIKRVGGGNLRFRPRFTDSWVDQRDVPNLDETKFQHSVIRTHTPRVSFYSIPATPSCHLIVRPFRSDFFLGIPFEMSVSAPRASRSFALVWISIDCVLAFVCRVYKVSSSSRERHPNPAVLIYSSQLLSNTRITSFNQLPYIMSTPQVCGFVI